MDAEAEIRFLITAINDLKVRPNTNRQADPITSQNPPEKGGFEEKVGGRKSPNFAVMFYSPAIKAAVPK